MRKRMKNGWLSRGISRVFPDSGTCLATTKSARLAAYLSLPECEMFSAPTASPVALGRAVPILADAVKVPLKFEKPIFTL